MTRPFIKLSRNIYKSKNPYRLSDKAETRRLALKSEIMRKVRNDNIKKAEAAKKKKARLNALRIYRKNNIRGTKKFAECKILTSDMRYIDRKYLNKTNKTRNICGKKSVP